MKIQSKEKQHVCEGRSEVLGIESLGWKLEKYVLHVDARYGILQVFYQCWFIELKEQFLRC